MSFYAKSVSFWPNEWIFKYSDKIMPCKLWVFLNINFCAKTLILGKKIEILWEMLTFSNNCALLLKVNILLEKILIFRKLWLLYDCLYTSRNCQILIKTSIFLGNVYLYMCVFSLKYFIYWKIVILIQNIILFGNILDKSVIFQVEFTFQVVSILWTNWAIFWEKVTILEKRQLALEVI